MLFFYLDYSYGFAFLEILPLLEKPFSLLFSQTDHFAGLRIGEVALLGQFDMRLEPYLAELLRAFLADMYVSAALVEILVVEKERPDDFRRDVE